MARITRFLGTLLGVGLVTFVFGEIGARVIGIRPLSEAAEVYEAHPRWGWHYRPGSSGEFVKLGARQQVEIGSRGLREREIPHERTPGVARVLVLGDSAVVGMEVAPEEVFPRVAERSLQERGRAVEFINAGCRGWGTDQSLLFLEDEGVRYRPDLVLYFWNPNDVEDNQTVHRPYRMYGKSYFDLAPDGSLVLKGAPVPEYPATRFVRVGSDGNEVELDVTPVVQAQMWLRDNVVMKTAFGTALAHLVAAVPQLTAAVVGRSTFDAGNVGIDTVDRESRLFRVTVAMVREMARIAEQNGAQFQLLGTPDPWLDAVRAEAGLAPFGDMQEFVARMKQFYTEHPGGEKFLVPFDTHWNAFGHRVYGEVLADRIEAANLLP